MRTTIKKEYSAVAVYAYTNFPNNEPRVEVAVTDPRRNVAATAIARLDIKEANQLIGMLEQAIKQAKRQSKESKKNKNNRNDIFDLYDDED